MQKRKFLLFLIITLMLSTVVFLPKNIEAASTMPKGSTIANVSIEGKTNSEVRKLLEEEITIWQAGEPIHLTSDFEQLAFPREAFKFDIDKTINEFNERTKRTFTSFFMRPKNVDMALHVEIDETHETAQAIHQSDYINETAIFANLEKMGSELKESGVSITYLKGKDIPLELIAEIELEVPELSNAVFTYAINSLHEFIVPPNDTFFLLHAVDFPENLTQSTDEISFIGSALYSLFLQANFDIIERHAPLKQAAYIEPGVDVVISEKENKNLIVKNRNKVAYKIELEKHGDTLTAALYSSPSDITYTYELENKTEINQRTLYRYSKRLNYGEEETIQAGRKGLRVEVYRSLYENNIYQESELISHDVYLPEPTIKLVSTSTEIPEEDLIGDSIDEIDDDLNELEQKVDELDANSESLSFPIGNPTMPTISAQLHEIRELQKILKEKVDLLEAESLVSSEEMKIYQQEIEEKFTNINDQIEEILEFFLRNGGGSEINE